MEHDTARDVDVMGTLNEVLARARSPKRDASRSETPRARIGEWLAETRNNETKHVKKGRL